MKKRLGYCTEYSASAKKPDKLDKCCAYKVSKRVHELNEEIGDMSARSAVRWAIGVTAPVVRVSRSWDDALVLRVGDELTSSIAHVLRHIAHRRRQICDQKELLVCGKEREVCERERRGRIEEREQQPLLLLRAEALVCDKRKSQLINGKRSADCRCTAAREQNSTVCTIHRVQMQALSATNNIVREEILQHSNLFYCIPFKWG